MVLRSDVYFLQATLLQLLQALMLVDVDIMLLQLMILS